MVVDANQTAGDGAALALRYEHQPVLRHIRFHAMEKVRRQIGRIAMLKVGSFIAVVKKTPVFCADIGTQRPAKAYACIRHSASLLSDFFALFLGETC